MKYYSVIDVTPTNNDWIPAYLPAVMNLMNKYGGKYLARTSNHEQLEGEPQEAALRLVIEWPSKDTVHNFMKDPDYAVHFKGRTEGSISNHFLIEGKDEFA